VVVDDGLGEGAVAGLDLGEVLPDGDELDSYASGGGGDLLISELWFPRRSMSKAAARRSESATKMGTSRIRALFYAGKPNWDLLATITPR
jgi:hypothetical protein